MGKLKFDHPIIKNVEHYQKPETMGKTWVIRN